MRPSMSSVPTHLNYFYKSTCVYCLTSHHVATFDTAKVDVPSSTSSRSGHRFVQQGEWLAAKGCSGIFP